MWSDKNTVQIHMELTNACNAACPMCVRFHNNSPLTRPDLEIGQITLELFKKYIPNDILTQINLIMFCGVHGDPGVARDTYEICKHIAETSPNTNIMMNSNGGMRTPSWWSKMGKLFSKKKHWLMTFSIDGLENSNHLYRRNVEWNKLEANVKAFTQHNPRSAWDFLIFAHNEHQLEEAKARCKEFNITEFIPKKALGVDNGVSLKRLPALTKDGELDYYIDAPLDPKNRNLENPTGPVEEHYQSFDKTDYYLNKKKKHLSINYYQTQVVKVYDNIDDTKWDNVEINCKSHKTFGTEIFIDNFGRVMPCCYVGTHLNGTYTSTESMQLHKALNDYGWEKFDLNLKPLTEILSEGHLNRVFADTWNLESVKCGKMAFCADTCGKNSSLDRIFTHEDIEDATRFNLRNTDV
jgi:MoaA/NifB/PqqE/SkfB family radical SAM enzyme